MLDQLDLLLVKRATPIVLFAVFWGWETLRPFRGRFDDGAGSRLRHGGRNLALALTNTILLAILFGVATSGVAEWTRTNQYGLLAGLEGPTRWALALLILDGWMYLWHRANHAIPFLWRFHRMHHSDPCLDVTTATRFHLGEHTAAAGLRLALIPLVGLELEQLILYDTLLLAVTQFHHADISIGRFDPWLRWLLVTPAMHKVHHSRLREETDSNYSTILSFWDRLAGTFRRRDDLGSLQYGLDEFADPRWQTWSGMWRTPLAGSELDTSAASEDPGGFAPPSHAVGMSFRPPARQ